MVQLIQKVWLARDCGRGQLVYFHDQQEHVLVNTTANNSSYWNLKMWPEVSEHTAAVEMKTTVEVVEVVVVVVFMALNSGCARIVETGQRKIAVTRGAGLVARGADMIAALT
ncbi:hypothetical protein PIB30_091657 [Stylosanthes scabra]|uniref:Uncharacterized protein n=1 Tax=Stylosanthes scabra TaxID=79078 RepID=A0ABU6RVZ4_9FABA|nr:hypothetical protein [Stylosanthes scabra]